ncbi:MAG: hypothetical protein QW594_04390, partial [Candidatus Woesearchaeota archaeon]
MAITIKLFEMKQFFEMKRGKKNMHECGMQQVSVFQGIAYRQPTVLSPRLKKAKAKPLLFYQHPRASTKASIFIFLLPVALLIAFLIGMSAVSEKLKFDHPVGKAGSTLQDHATMLELTQIHDDALFRQGLFALRSEFFIQGAFHQQPECGSYAGHPFYLYAGMLCLPTQQQEFSLAAQDQLPSYLPAFDYRIVSVNESDRALVYAITKKRRTLTTGEKTIDLEGKE